MNFKLKYTWLLLFLFVFAACSDDDDNNPDENLVALDPGTADFTKYVAVGNSLTSGLTDGALFKVAQENSFPNILATKFALVGGGAFTQPLTNDNIGGLLLGGNVIQPPRYYFDGKGPVLLPAVPTTEVSSIIPGPYNNMGVPGALSFHFLAKGYGNIAGLQTGQANPYYVRMASSPTASILEDAMAQNPTFFTLWAGFNDVLGYAVTGGDGTIPITDQPTFNFAITTLVSTLTSKGAKGLVVNITDVAKAAHFRTVPYNALNPATNPAFAAQIPTLNATFAQLNQAFAFLGVPERSVVYSESAPSPILIRDESLANITPQLAQVLIAGGLPAQTAGLLANQFGQSRQAKSTDLFVLPSSSVIGTLNNAYFQLLVSLGVSQAQAGQLAVNGITYPMQDKWVLLPGEQEQIATATGIFNSIIKAETEKAGLAFLDANALMNQLTTTGISSGNFVLNAKLVTGGAFSLDGLHLTSRGSAMIANEIMKSIDKTYGSNFEEAGELVNIGDYPTNYNPALR